jgi:hypothetical protein
MAALSPCTDKVYEAENILKTKGRKRAFSKNEAESILKIKQLQETIGIPKKHDKLTARRGLPWPAAGGEKGLRSLYI